MKTFLVLLLIGSTSLASATKYYISSTTGDDNLDGKSPATAWKAIAKVNGKTFLPGDSILFRRGDIWRETLILPSSGISGNYITFSSFGTGENPKILGSTKAITWTETATGSHIWKSATSFPSNPYTSNSNEIFFENTDASKSWGTYKTGTASLSTEYDWTWVTNNIYVYSITDPTTKYNSVEVPQRESTVNMNKKNYIHFDGIDMMYSYWSGYGYDYTHNDMFEQFGLIIENSEICCIGAWDPTIEQGYGIEVVYTDMIVRNNRFHDCGRRGFAMDVYGNGYTARNILVESNQFYNGFHTTGLDIDVGAGYTGSLDGIIVRRNFFYETSTTRAFDFSNLIFIQNNNTAASSINNVYIYSNIFKWPNGYGVLMENPQSVYIYNNVFFDKNVNASWAPFVAVQGSAHATVENNIFFKSTSGTTSEVEKNSFTINDYNLYYNCTVSGLESNGIFSKNPLFVDPGTNNFHLQASSPAIGAGIAITQVTTDYENNTFANPPNIGCYATPVILLNPVFVSALIANVTPSLLEITFNKTLSNVIPATSAFNVKVNSIVRSVSSVTISGTKVQLTLSGAVAYGDVITVAYTKPATNPVQSSTGMAADSFTDQPVTNNVASAAPVYVSSVIENATPTLLEITFSLSLANIIPAATAFTVKVNNVTRTISTLTISATKVRLTLSGAVSFGDVVTVAYTKPSSNQLQTTGGTAANSFTDQPVINNLVSPVPVYVSSVIEDATPALLEITFSLSLANIIPAATAFNVKVNNVTRTVNTVTISATKVRLTLSGAVVFGDVVTVAYTKPATNPLQTSSAGQVASFTAKTVTNNVNIIILPVYVSSVIEDITPTLLEITFSLSLASITPAPSAFIVMVNSTPRIVNTVSVNGTVVKLTLVSPVIHADVVTVAYTKPASNPLQTTSGNQAATFTARNVINNVGVINTPPNIITTYSDSITSGFVGVIDAIGTYDIDNDALTYSWTAQAGTDISSSAGPIIQFLAPIVDSPANLTFTLNVSDGKSISTKNIQIIAIPYEPHLTQAVISLSGASNYSGSDLPINVLDGDSSTFWSANGDNQWLVFKSQEPFMINSFRISFSHTNMGASFFDILASKDSINWDLMISDGESCGFSDNLQIFKSHGADTIPYKYIEFIGHGNSLNMQNRVFEFQVFGVAENSPAGPSNGSLTIYPNPASDVIKVILSSSLPEPRIVRIANILGEIINETKLETAVSFIEIPVKMHQGYYIIYLISGGKITAASKLIIK